MGAAEVRNAALPASEVVTLVEVHEGALIMIASPHFYDPSYLPPGAVRVHVWWIGHGVPRLYDAARVFNGRARQWVWYHQIDGEFYELPPRRDKAQWDEQPLCWRPMNDEWTWPGGRVPPHLPPHQVPRQSTEKQTFGAVEDAESEDIAREMQGWREDARRGSSASEGGEDVFKRWWRDLTQIRYELKGEVTRRMCEGRVMRAMAWAGAYNLMAPSTRITSNVLAAYAVEDLTQFTEEERKQILLDRPYAIKFEPTISDHSDFETAMSWVVAINPPDIWDVAKKRKAWSLSRKQRILYWRAKNVPLSFVEIAQAFQPKDPTGKPIGDPVTWQSIQQDYNRAIDWCLRAANGEPVRGKAPVRDRMSEVREGNRQFHNQR